MHFLFSGMRIQRMNLQNFRNHDDVEVEWAPALNVIVGPNGAGKTNLIDAIHYLCMSKSFVTGSDTHVLRQGESLFEIEGDFEGSIRSRFNLKCVYSRGEGKKFWVNESPLDRLADLIGMVPVVVLSPNDRKLTNEGPAERRSFIDGFISQLSRQYLRDIIDYRRVVKQRNRLLQTYMDPTQMSIYIEPWNEQLITLGSRVIAKRTQVINRFQEYLSRQYQRMSGVGIQPNLLYQPFCSPSEDEAGIRKAFGKELERVADKERERQFTLVGPHRDEIVFKLDDMEVRKFGSQGQHRLFALSLKMAQLFYYSDELDDLPIFLLDDVFGDLDPHKTDVLFEALNEHTGQIFITSADPELIEGRIHEEDFNHRSYKVEDGGKITMMV